MSAYWKIGISVAAIAVSVLQVGCQQQAKVAGPPAVPEAEEPPSPAVQKAEPEPAEGQPRIKFESLVYDFGKVGPGQRMAGEFKLTNAGDAPLKITGVDKCCGAVTKLDRQELAPGESTLLHVQYISSTMPGVMSKRLYVNSNDKVTPKAELTIKAETVVKVAHEPKSLKMLIKDQEAGCPKITLKSTDSQPFSITSFRASNGALIADIDSAVQATEFVLQPKADAAKLQKTRSGRITISLVFAEAGTPAETINIIFQALSRFTVNPSMLVVLYDKPAEPAKKTLWITNNSGEDFEVESASSAEGHIAVLSQNKLGNRYQFSLQITPPEGATRQFADTFTVNLKGGEKLTVPCRGVYNASTAKPKPAGQ